MSHINIYKPGTKVDVITTNDTVISGSVNKVIIYKGDQVYYDVCYWQGFDVKTVIVHSSEIKEHQMSEMMSLFFLQERNIK